MKRKRKKVADIDEMKVSRRFQVEEESEKPSPRFKKARRNG